MKRNLNVATWGLLLVIIHFLSACASKQKSDKTGMTYNDNSNGGYQKFKKTYVPPAPGLVPIEGGTFVIGGSLNEDLGYNYDMIRRRVTVASFYMDETEVSNQDWLDYLHWTRINFPDDRELYYKALPDTLVWRRPLSYNEPYVDNYLRHPAFQDYPVVGVSWEQAQDYCQWRTDRVNEQILRERGILVDWKKLNKKGGEGEEENSETPKEPFNTDIYLNGQYRGKGIDGKNMPKDLMPDTKSNGEDAGENSDEGSGKSGTRRRPVRREDGILKEAYRLPTEAEWEYAALSLAANTAYENINKGKIYPWNGLGVRSAKKKTRGLMLANFKRGGGDNMGTGGYLNDKADITAPVRSYEPNDFGLYNMAGNVNEWTQDVYRQLSFEDFEDFNPFRGNVYEDKKLADANKGILAKDKYGRPIKEPARTDKKEPWGALLARQEINNSQGPTTGETVPGQPKKVEEEEEIDATTTVSEASAPTKKPFNADVRDYADSSSNFLYGVTTLVNNRSRVYKGGSWNDRAYWLNPATRRFLDQSESSAEIGFRCAMTMSGPPEINHAGKPQFKVKAAKVPGKIK